MASAGQIIELFGRGTTTGNVADTIATYGAGNLDKLNASAQVAASVAGLAAAVSPGSAISAGLFAADVQFTKLIADLKNNPSPLNIGQDLVGLLSDAAIIGAGVASYLGRKDIGAIFGVLGAAADIAGVSLNHPEIVEKAAQNAIDSAKSAGSTALDAVGNIIGSLRDAFTGFINKSQTPDVGILERSFDTNLASIGNSLGISTISSDFDSSGKNTLISLTDTQGLVHDFATNQDGNSLNFSLSNHEITLGTIVAANIFGSNNHLIMTGSGAFAGIQGTGEIVNNNNASNLVNLNGNGSSATFNGVGGIGLFGSGQNVAANGVGNQITVYGGFTGESITASGANITLGSGASANISGSDDSIHLWANSGSYVGVFGQNQRVDGDNGSNSINLGGDGTSATVYGTGGVGGYVGMVGNNQNLTLGNWGFNVVTASNVQGLNITGDHSNITLGGGTSANVWGSNNTLGMAGGNAFAGIQGTGETINNNDPTGLVNLNGNGSSAIVNGTGSLGLYGSNQNVTFNSIGNRVAVYGGFTGESITASGANITLGGSSSANVFGANSTISLMANSNAYVGVFGQNQWVYGDSGNNGVNLGGAGTSATIYGSNGVGGYVGMVDNGQHLTLGNWGFSVGTAANLRDLDITGDHANISFATHTSGNVYAQDSTVNLQNNSNSYVGFFGSGTIFGNTGNYANLGGKDTKVTVHGTGTAGITESNQVLTLTDNGATIVTASDVKGVTIFANHASINFAANVGAKVVGEDNTIIAGENNNIFVEGKNNNIQATDINTKILFSGGSNYADSPYSSNVFYYYYDPKHGNNYYSLEYFENYYNNPSFYDGSWQNYTAPPSTTPPDGDYVEVGWPITTDPNGVPIHSNGYGIQESSTVTASSVSSDSNVLNHASQLIAAMSGFEAGSGVDTVSRSALSLPVDTGLATNASEITYLRHAA